MISIDPFWMYAPGVLIVRQGNKVELGHIMCEHITFYSFSFSFSFSFFMHEHIMKMLSDQKLAKFVVMFVCHNDPFEGRNNHWSSIPSE